MGISSQFRTILTIFDPPLPPSYSIYGSLSDLRTLLSFDSPYTFNFRFASLLRTISAVSTLLYPPPYSIPSPVISVVTMAVIEVPGIYFTLRSPPSIYGSLFRFTVPSSAFRLSNLPLPPPRPVIPALRQ
jgi:hypothetical protein